MSIDVKAIAAQITAELGLSNSPLVTGDAPEFALTKLQTGVLPFDVMLGGGLPRNRISLFHGAPATLKTYLMLSCARVAQQHDELAIIIDTEHSYDPEWARHIGCNPEKLIVMQPTTGEEAENVIEHVLQAYDPAFIGWDSLAATLTLEEASKTATEVDKVATLARFTNRLFKRINTLNRNTAILILNQERTNIGVTYGSNKTLPGGKPVLFYPSVVFSATKVGKEAIKADVYQHNKAVKVDHVSGVFYKIEATKDRTQPLGPPVGFVWRTEAGEVDEIGFALDMGVNLGIIEVSGKSFSWTAPDGTAVTGTEMWRFGPKIRDNQEYAQALMEQVLLTACPSLVVQP